jgi:hypothetical protein
MNKRIIAALIATLGIASPLAARAQSDDVRREDRREDRREMRLEVPRDAAGAIDLDKLAAEIRQLFDQGVREVRIREEGLSAQERAQLADLARQLAAQLGVERLRVRDEGNRLRIDLRNEREAREDRREARREDRADRREDRVERREERHEQIQRPERNERAERPEREERAERPERNERVERPERAERMERPERPERQGRGG